jgi:ankyrin repeat protein
LDKEIKMLFKIIVSVATICLLPSIILAQPQEVIDAYNLENAIKNGNATKVQELVQSGIDVNVQYNGNSSLHIACQEGAPELVELLLGAGADINSMTEDGSGLTPLQMVTWGFGAKKSPEVFNLLLNHGADPNLSNGRYEYPLIYAIEVRSPDMVKLLLQNSARIDIKSKSGNTPLEHINYVDKVLSNAATTEEDREKLQQIKALLAESGEGSQELPPINSLRIE